MAQDWRRLTRAQRITSGTIFIVWVAVGWVLHQCFRPVRALGSAMAKGICARMLNSNEYEGLHLTAHKLNFVKFMSAEVEHGLLLLLDKRVRKAWSQCLNVLIIVLGLLTTSSYQAVYGNFEPVTGAVATVQTCFRAANAVSFLSSIVSIFVSALMILSLHKYDNSGRLILAPWSRALMYFGYQLALKSFFTSPLNP